MDEPILRNPDRLWYLKLTVTVRRTKFYYDAHTSVSTRSSAVAVITDRTAYDVRYTIKLSNRFWLKFKNGWYERSDSTGRVYERTQTLSTQA